MHTCPTCNTPLVCPHCTGQAGGQSRSPAKQAAARANGAKGGRPIGSGKKRHDAPPSSARRSTPE